ncbi:unnamed protein product, partial [marine sediment metagenome]
SDLVSDGDTIVDVTNNSYFSLSELDGTPSTEAIRMKPLFDAKVDLADSTGTSEGTYITGSDGADIVSDVEQNATDIADTNPISTYAPIKTNSGLYTADGYATMWDANTYHLKYTIGTTTYAPANGDSILWNDSLLNKAVLVFRDGVLLDTATAPNVGYEVTDSSLTVHPIYSTGDRMDVLLKKEEVLQSLVPYDPTGPEMITNGDFASATGWGVDDRWTIAGDSAAYDDAVGYGSLKQEDSFMASSMADNTNY